MGICGAIQGKSCFLWVRNLVNGMNGTLQRVWTGICLSLAAILTTHYCVISYVTSIYYIKRSLHSTSWTLTRQDSPGLTCMTRTIASFPLCAKAKILMTRSSLSVILRRYHVMGIEWVCQWRGNIMN